MGFDRNLVRYDPLLNGLVFWATYDDGQPTDYTGRNGINVSNEYQYGNAVGPTPKLKAFTYTLVGSVRGTSYKGALDGPDNGDFSLAFWLKTTYDAGSISRATGNNASWAVGVNLFGGAGTLAYVGYPLNFPGTNSNFNQVTDGKWHHYAVTRLGTTSLRIYVDKAIDTDTGTFQAGTGISSDVFAVSRLGLINSYSFNGDLADVRVYNRAISAAEVIGIYNYAFQPVDDEMPMLSVSLDHFWQLYFSKNSGAYNPVTTTSVGVKSADASSDTDETKILIPRLS